MADIERSVNETETSERRSEDPEITHKPGSPTAAGAADVTPVGSREPRDRGQLLLITAFVLAASFVALALVVNSAIFTENLATREDVPGSTDTLTYRYEVTQSLGAALEYVNENNNSDQASLEDAAKAEIRTISAQGSFQQSTRGRVVNVSYADAEFGHRIAQSKSGNFSNATNATRWQLADGVERTRAFRIEVTNPNGINETGETFQVQIDDGSDSWELGVVRNSSDLELTVETSNGDTARCRRPIDSMMTIDVTGASFAGQPCHALSIQSDGTPMRFRTGVADGYEIRFTNGQDIEGRYSLVIGSNGSANTTNLAEPSDPPATDGPFVADAIYALDVRYRYHTPDLGYETTIRVAPGEVST